MRGLRGARGRGQGEGAGAKERMKWAVELWCIVNVRRHVIWKR